jgi:hypothetical protein
MKPATTEIILTFDVDWCPDWMIDEVAELMVQSGVKSTWFVTHSSPSINKLRERSDLFELGIHPNCLPGSTHGSNECEVLQHVKAIVPEAVSMRSHGLYQTSAFLMLAARDFGIQLESNVLLPHTAGIAICDWRMGDIAIRRVPIFWEDDVAMRDPLNTWREAGELTFAPGLKVFNFHPLFVVMNANDFAQYVIMREERPIPEWTPEFVEPHRSSGIGTRAVLKNLIEELSGHQTLFLKDLLSIEAIGPATSPGYDGCGESK